MVKIDLYNSAKLVLTGIDKYILRVLVAIKKN
jgi:hypothetical protein